MVSLETGKACIKALKNKGYKVSKFDPKYKNLNLIDKKKVDIIFNALHGKDGEDGIAQTYFEYLKIPYTHSGIISSYNAMNKLISKEIFLKKKIKTPRYFPIRKNNFNKFFIFNKLKKTKFGYPIIVKPVNEGSSLGVSLCKNRKSLIIEIKKLFKRYDELILEKYIGGQEIQVAVLNGRALGAIELVPKRLFYDYKAKYTKAAKTEHLMPAKISKEKYKKVLKIAKKAHDIFKCRGVTRSDFKYFKGNFYMLEINTQPGMTIVSLVQ